MFGLPHPYADTLKKEIICKKLIWLHFMLFQDSVEGIEEGRKHASPPDLCTPSALLWQQQALHLLLGREEPGPRGIFDLPIALFSTRILPSQCMTLDQGLGLVREKL